MLLAVTRNTHDAEASASSPSNSEPTAPLGMPETPEVEEPEASFPSPKAKRRTEKDLGQFLIYRELIVNWQPVFHVIRGTFFQYFTTIY